MIAVVFSVVNRGRVTIDAWPLPYTIELPLFLVVMLGLVGGFLVGALFGWLGAAKARRLARVKAREAEAAQRQARELSEKLARLEAVKTRSAALPVPADAA